MINNSKSKKSLKRKKSDKSVKLEMSFDETIERLSKVPPPPKKKPKKRSPRRKF